MKFLAIIPALTFAVSACAVTPKSFYEDPAKAKDTAVCRAMLETTDAVFRQDAYNEVTRRGLTLKDCENRVAMETAAIVGIAALATGVAVVAACQNGCAAPRHTPSYLRGPDYDCLGGGGDGPLYVRGPVQVGWDDPYDLDRDGDGIGCEPFGDFGA